MIDWVVNKLIGLDIRQSTASQIARSVTHQRLESFSISRRMNSLSSENGPSCTLIRMSISGVFLKTCVFNIHYIYTVWHKSLTMCPITTICWSSNAMVNSQLSSSFRWWTVVPLISTDTVSDKWFCLCCISHWQPILSFNV